VWLLRRAPLHRSSHLEKRVAHVHSSSNLQKQSGALHWHGYLRALITAELIGIKLFETSAYDLIIRNVFV
jgi:hypothetical protein